MTTPVIITGFEYGVDPNTSGFGLIGGKTGTPVIDGTIKHTGSYSMRCQMSSEADYVSWTLTTGIQEVVARLYVRWETLPSGAICRVLTGAQATGGAYIAVNTSGKWIAGIGGGSTVTLTTGPVANQWYCIDVYMKSNANPNTMDWKIDGTAQTQATGATAAQDITIFRAGSTVATTGDMYIDDIVVSYTAADYPIGAGGTQRLAPSSEGTHNIAAGTLQNDLGSDIDGSLVTAYPLLNDLPVSSADYVRQAGASTTSYAEVLFDNISDTHSAVIGAAAFLCYTSATTSANTAGCIVSKDSFSTSTTVWGAPGALSDYSDGSTTNLYFKSAIIAGVTDDTTVNALKGRVGYAGDATPDPYWIDMWVEVAYTVSTGPNNYTQTLTTTEAISDVIAMVRGYNRTLTTTEAISDAITKLVNRFKTLTDTSGITDAISTLKASAWTYLVQTTEAISDSISTLKTSAWTYLVQTTEGISDAISLVREWARAVSDTEGISTSIANARGFGKSLADSVGITDSIAKAAEFIKTLANSLGITDSVLGEKLGTAYEKLIQTTEAISDSVSNAINRARSLTDSVGITDAISKSAGFGKLLTATVGITDSVARVINYIRTLTITEAISDATDAFSGLVKLISDTVGITDASSKIYNAVRIFTESEGISDSISKVSSFIRTLTSTEGITTLVSNARGLVVTITNNLGITDFLSAEKTSYQNFVTSILDNMGISDNLQSQVNYLRTKSDSVSISDNIALTKVLLRAISDNVGLTDSISRVSTFFKTITNTETSTDLVSRGMSYIITLVSSVSISDIITAIQNYIAPPKPHVNIAGSVDSIRLSGKAVRKPALSGSVDPTDVLSGDVYKE